MSSLGGDDVGQLQPEAASGMAKRRMATRRGRRQCTPQTDADLLISIIEEHHRVFGSGRGDLNSLGYKKRLWKRVVPIYNQRKGSLYPNRDKSQLQNFLSSQAKNLRKVVEMGKGSRTADDEGDSVYQQAEAIDGENGNPMDGDFSSSSRCRRQRTTNDLPDKVVQSPPPSPPPLTTSSSSLVAAAAGVAKFDAEDKSKDVEREEEAKMVQHQAEDPQENILDQILKMEGDDNQDEEESTVDQFVQIEREWKERPENDDDDDEGEMMEQGVHANDQPLRDGEEEWTEARSNRKGEQWKRESNHRALAAGNDLQDDLVQPQQTIRQQLQREKIAQEQQELGLQQKLIKEQMQQKLTQLQQLQLEQKLMQQQQLMQQKQLMHQQELLQQQQTIILQQREQGQLRLKHQGCCDCKSEDKSKSVEVKIRVPNEDDYEGLLKYHQVLIAKYDLELKQLEVKKTRKEWEAAEQAKQNDAVRSSFGEKSHSGGYD